MKTVDRLLQRWRIAKIRPFLKPGARLLDIGCADGALARLAPEVGAYLGVDPGIEDSDSNPNCRRIKGRFPEALPDDAGEFDAIAMLAVLEHIPPAAQHSLAEACRRYLRPGGVALITVPCPAVDYLLAALKFLRVIDGMSLEEHYGFDVRQTPACFVGAGLPLLVHRRFQLGLNHLFVFRKPPDSMTANADGRREAELAATSA
ncbi:MAG TPA: class I SAM-dependent methyltransferase [Pirellulales bacterium]|jgi:SAM-dependent methyltransferase|nr:class I SAM-dependent methyltransferase [Pirellulales bacterium]